MLLSEPILPFGIPFDFVLFAVILLGIAIFQRHSLPIALAGLVAITAYKLSFTGFKEGTSLAGLAGHLLGEFSLLANLFLLLMGFALLARHLEESAIPDLMPAVLPDGWKGGGNATWDSFRTVELSGQHCRCTDWGNSCAAHVR
jgi:hypothetical protein